MVLDRRGALHVLGTAGLTALAGCSTGDVLTEGDENPEYALRLYDIDASPVEAATYEPSDGALFGDPARTALEEILPEGRHTTYGYAPLGDELYVEHDGTYYETENVVTGRERMDRRTVSVETVPEEDVPADALLVDDLPRWDGRVVKILHSHAVSDGRSGSAELLRGDSYVLRRPVEREGRLASGDLDGRVVTMEESGTWAYRIRVRTETITETAHTALAVEVADSRPAFREVVFGSRVDAELAPEDLGEAAREVLAEAIRTESYSEHEPLSDAYWAVLRALKLASVNEYANDRRLWYDGEYYRYSLYIDDPS
jgi:hypothetical protein